jgi:hypothetical protein
MYKFSFFVCEELKKEKKTARKDFKMGYCREDLVKFGMLRTRYVETTRAGIMCHFLLAWEGKV